MLLLGPWQQHPLPIIVMLGYWGGAVDLFGVTGKCSSVLGREFTIRAFTIEGTTSSFEWVVSLRCLTFSLQLKYIFKAWWFHFTNRDFKKGSVVVPSSDVPIHWIGGLRFFWLHYGTSLSGQKSFKMSNGNLCAFLWLSGDIKIQI